MGSDWNNFLQSRPVRLAMNAFCAVICGFYAVGAALDLVNPSESSLMLIETMGKPGFYVLTFVRMLVCAWVCVVFARSAFKLLKEKD